MQDGDTLCIHSSIQRAWAYKRKSLNIQVYLQTEQRVLNGLQRTKRDESGNRAVDDVDDGSRLEREDERCFVRNGLVQ